MFNANSTPILLSYFLFLMNSPTHQESLLSVVFRCKFVLVTFDTAQIKQRFPRSRGRISASSSRVLSSTGVLSSARGSFVVPGILQQFDHPDSQTSAIAIELFVVGIGPTAFQICLRGFSRKRYSPNDLSAFNCSPPRECTVVAPFTRVRETTQGTTVVE